MKTSPRAALARFRRPAIGWLQLFVVLVWTVTPAMRTGAIFVPDESGVTPPYYWVPLSVNDPEPSTGPDLGDANSNDTPDWRDDFNAAVDAGTLVWWPGGAEFQGNPFVIDGVAASFPAQWRPANEPDNDGDGIPDDLDLHPTDPTNNSYRWPGGQIVFAGHNFVIRAKWFAGSGADSNANSAPDCMEATLTAIASSTSYLWPGGTFLLNGEYSSFPPWHLYECDTGDDDSDGLPNAIDPHPNDAWNGTRYWWDGGTFVIDGGFTPFGPNWHAGFSGGDSDTDGIPNALDPYVDDSTNNSVFWSGGTWSIDGVPITFPGQYHAATTGDGDGDGIPDSLDPYPADSSNTSGSTWWPGGDFVIDGAWVSLPGLSILNTDGDTDGDGIPDSFDPYFGDSSNNSFEWGGGNFTANNATLDFPNGWYAGSWSDADNDGIPGSVDPYPDDSNNGNQSMYYWEGGTFPVDGSTRTWYPDNYYGTWADSDGDSIPDSPDPYPDDPDNNCIARFWWGGGSFLVDSTQQIFPGQYCVGSLDADGHFPDLDSDGIPDSADPYPSSPFNGTPGFYWPPYDSNGAPTTLEYVADMQNNVISFTTAMYFWEWLDTDEDGIPDIADPYAQDGYNGRDTDTDGIPDSVEVAYNLQPGDPSDAQTPRVVEGESDGLNWQQAYALTSQGSVGNLLDSLFDTALDSDSDGMSDLYEIINGLNRYDKTDAADAPIGSNGGDTSGSLSLYIFNVEKARGGMPVAAGIDDPGVYQQLTGHPPGQGVWHDPSKSVAENDWDGDGVSNVDEVVVFHTDARASEIRPTNGELAQAYLASQTSATTNINFADLFSAISDPALDGDGDGLTNGWETAHGLDPLDPTDAAADLDGDGLSNLEEMISGTDPTRADNPNVRLKVFGFASP